MHRGEAYEQKVPRLYHWEEGEEWDLLTDIAWVPQGAFNPTTEVLSLAEPQPPVGVFTSLEYNSRIRLKNVTPFEAFLNAYRSAYRCHRRGLHLHVQFRDVHEAGVAGSGEYLRWAYSEAYLRSVPPEDDLNVWGDGFDEALVAALPPHHRGAGVSVDVGNESLTTALGTLKATAKRTAREAEAEESAGAAVSPEKIPRVTYQYAKVRDCDRDGVPPSCRTS